jgi:hypothetical protein
MAFKFTYTPDPDDVAIEDVFKSHGVPFKNYNLVNNYGWTATTPSGHRLDVRHVLNVYGVAVDFHDFTIWNPEGDIINIDTPRGTVTEQLDALLTKLKA